MTAAAASWNSRPRGRQQAKDYDDCAAACVDFFSGKTVPTPYATSRIFEPSFSLVFFSDSESRDVD